MQHVGAGRGFEDLARQVRRPAGARTGKRQLARLRPGQRHQFLRGFGRQLGRHHQHERQFGHLGDRDQAVGVIGQLGIQRGIDRLRADIARHQRVAVRPGARRQLQANVAGRAGPVVHQHRLAPELRQALRHQARGNVGAAAGRERQDDRDRPCLPAGVGLRVGGRCQQRRGGKAQGQQRSAPAVGENGVWHGGLVRFALSGECRVIPAGCRRSWPPWPT
ncbi:hypothetical protein D3C72_1498760 [compost metagenome]